MILIKNTYRTLIKFAVRRRAPSGTVSVHHQGSSFPFGGGVGVLAASSPVCVDMVLSSTSRIMIFVIMLNNAVIVWRFRPCSCGARGDTLDVPAPVLRLRLFLFHLSKCFF